MSFTSLLRGVKVSRRLEEILVVLARHELGFLLKEARITHLLPWQHRVRQSYGEGQGMDPVRLRLIFEELGGTFIKLGQLLSMRPDLVPHEYCDELRKLQDAVPPFSYAEARAVIRDELGDQAAAFRRIEEKPIASASIGQVYRATLHDGKAVVIKVQRPHEKARYAIDIDILERLAAVIHGVYADLPFDAAEIVREFKDYTDAEFDYTIEAETIGRFYRNFFERPDVRIPQVRPELSTRRVLTMEYMEGASIATLARIKGMRRYKEAMLRRFLSAMLQQILADGLFHADPHPGNVFVERNTLIFLDFGIVGYLGPEDRHAIRKIFLSILSRDTGTLARGLIAIGVAKSSVDRSALEEDIQRYFSAYYDSDVGRISLRDLFLHLFAVVRKHDLRMPTHFVLLGKALMTTESVIQQIDPGFNLIKESMRYGRALEGRGLRARISPGKVLASAGRLRDFLFSLPERSEDISYKLDEFNENVDRIHTDLGTLTRTIDHSVKTIALSLLFFGFLIVGYVLRNAYSWLFYGLAVVLMLMLIVDYFRR